MKGDLQAGFDKGGRSMIRTLNGDRIYFTAPDGSDSSCRAAA
jgi:hypothetical protein